MKHLKDILSIESIDHYPIVLLPQSLKKFIADYNEFHEKGFETFIWILDEDLGKRKEALESETISYFNLQKPALLFPPREPPPLHPKYFYTRNERWKFYRSLITPILLLIPIILGYILYTRSADLKGLLFISYLSIIILLFKMVSVGEKYRGWRRALRKIRQVYPNWISQYNEEVKNYPAKMKQYPEDNLKYQQEIKSFERNVKAKMNEYLFVKCKQSFKPIASSYRLKEPTKKSRVESNFLEALQLTFGDKIKVDTCLKYYYPDFAFIDVENQLNIDIEVDEEYDFISKKPIHFVQSEDESRNETFLSQNWFVIRFTENQILNFPSECCEFLKNTISKIMLLDSAPATQPQIPVEK